MTAARIATAIAGLDAIQREGGGIWRLGLYHRSTHPDDPDLCRAIAAFITEPNAKPSQCFLCTAPFSLDDLPEGILTLAADVPAPQNLLSGGICAACWRGQDVREQVRAVLAGGLGVPVRVLDIGTAGHA